MPYSINLTELESDVVVTVTFKIPKSKINFIKKTEQILDAVPSDLSKLFNLPIPVIDKIVGTFEPLAN